MSPGDTLFDEYYIPKLYTIAYCNPMFEEYLGVRGIDLAMVLGTAFLTVVTFAFIRKSGKLYSLTNVDINLIRTDFLDIDATRDNADKEAEEEEEGETNTGDDDQ
jgi:hypothetical protein